MHTQATTPPWTVELSRYCRSLTVIGEGYTCIWWHARCFLMYSKASLECCKRWNRVLAARLQRQSVCWLSLWSLQQRWICCSTSSNNHWHYAGPSQVQDHILNDIFCDCLSLFDHRVGLSLMFDCMLGLVCYCGIYCSANLIHCAMMHKGHNILSITNGNNKLIKMKVGNFTPFKDN